MREYIIIFKQPNEDIDPDCTVASDYEALMSGALKVEELLELAASGGITINYIVRDIDR